MGKDLCFEPLVPSIQYYFLPTFLQSNTRTQYMKNYIYNFISQLIFFQKILYSFGQINKMQAIITYKRLQLFINENKR